MCISLGEFSGEGFEGLHMWEVLGLSHPQVFSVKYKFNN